MTASPTKAATGDPLLARDKEKKTVDLVFEVGEGPRVYIERLDIIGNTRTKDKVIRREVLIAPGDVLNSVRVETTKTLCAPSHLAHQASW